MAEKTDHRLDTEKLAGRVALLNAENERMKRIILKYEKKLSEEISRQLLPASSAEKDRELERVRELSQQRLQEVEYWKREHSELKSRFDPGFQVPNNWEMVLNELHSFKQENADLRTELDRQSKGPLKSHGKENLVHGGGADHEKVLKECNRVIRNLKIEVDELTAKVEALRKEKAEMVSKEFHFEKLKEQEVRLVGSLSLSPSLTPTIIQLQNDLTALTNENEKLVRALREISQREKERRETIEEIAIARFEVETRKRMETLEHKINELIEENENILKENDQLKYSSTNIAKDRRMSGQRSVHSKDETEVAYKIRELESRLSGKETEIASQREFFESRIERLERELIDSRRKLQTTANPSNAFASQSMKQSLEEAYNLISKLEQENKLLLSRVGHLESDNKKRRADSQFVYELMENKSKSNTVSLREAISQENSSRPVERLNSE